MAPLLWLIFFFMSLASLSCFSIMSYFMVVQEKSFTLSPQIMIKQNPWKW